MSATCSSCGAEIIWAKTPAGKPIPLDVPTMKRVLIGAKTGLAHIVDVHTTHFETCPDAAKHRKSKAKPSTFDGKSKFDKGRRPPAEHKELEWTGSKLKEV